MEFLSGLIFGIATYLPAPSLLIIVGLFAIALFFENIDWEGTKFIWSVILVAYVSTYFNVSLYNGLVFGLPIYLAAGIIWSFYRYRRYVQDEIRKFDSSEKYMSFGDAHANRTVTLLEKLHPSRNITKIVDWIIFWPLSFTNNFIGDLIDSVRYLVKNTFKSIYMKIYKAATKDLIVIKTEKDTSENENTIV